MRRYTMSFGGITGSFDMYMSENPNGEWVEYKDVEKLVVKLTQGTIWNSSTSIPIIGKDCIVTLITGEKHPAIMGKAGWTKPIGYMYDFNKQDIVKWKYDETIIE